MPDADFAKWLAERRAEYRLQRAERWRELDRLNDEETARQHPAALTKGAEHG